MTDPRILDVLGFRNGYFNTDRLAFPENVMAEGSENVFNVGADSLRTFRGLNPAGTGGRVMFTLANGYGSLNDYTSGGTIEGSGSLFNYINESLWIAGSGRVRFNGAQLTDTVSAQPFTASSSLQLSPKTGSDTYERIFTAGMLAPSAPVVAVKDAGNGFTGLLDGLYSFKIARVRSLTGGRSNASTTSGVIVADGQTARLTFPLADSNGQDRWAIFATKSGFGGIGVHYLVMEIDEADLGTVDGVSRSYEIEFNDSDLLPITAYIDDYPPPACNFAARLENYILAIGCYDNAIAASIRNFGESFNPEHLGFLPKAPTAVLPVQLGAYLYVATESSVHAVSVSYAENPLMIQTLWSDTGIEHQHNWCAVEGVIFAFVAEQGAVTMDQQGQPSNEFALPIAREMRDWLPEHTRVFNHPKQRMVVFTNSATGKALCFNLQNRKWSSPAILSSFASGACVAGVVVDRQLKLSFSTGSNNFALYDFDVPNGATPVEYTISSPDRVINPGARVNIFGIKGVYYHSDNTEDAVFEIYADYDDVLPDKSYTKTSSVGMNTTVQTRWYLPRKEAYRVHFTTTQTDFTKDNYLSHVVVFGNDEMSNRI